VAICEAPESSALKCSAMLTSFSLSVPLNLVDLRILYAVFAIRLHNTNLTKKYNQTEQRVAAAVFSSQSKIHTINTKPYLIKF
jgi:hypothetical protein